MTRATPRCGAPEMTSSTGDDGAPATPGPDAPQAPAPPPSDPPRSGDEAVPGRDQRYDDAAEQVTEATSAADREEFRAALHELRGDVVAGDKIVVTGHKGAT